MRPAESTVTFGPIAQFGWASACSGVAAAIAAALQVRNGPPEAVEDHVLDRAGIRRRRAPGRSHCARCPSAGAARPAGGRAHERCAGADQAFLIGERDAAPGRESRMGRLDAGCSGDAPTTRSAGRSAASTTASRPAATSIPVDPQRLLERAHSPRDRRERRISHQARSRGVRAPAHRDRRRRPRPRRPRRTGDDFGGRAADRAGRAENDEPARRIRLAAAQVPLSARMPGHAFSVTRWKRPWAAAGTAPHLANQWAAKAKLR